MLILIEILVVLFIAYSVLGWSLYFMQPTFLYFPVREVPYNPGDIGLTYDPVTFKPVAHIKSDS